MWFESWCTKVSGTRSRHKSVDDLIQRDWNIKCMWISRSDGKKPDDFVIVPITLRPTRFLNHIWTEHGSIDVVPSILGTVMPSKILDEIISKTWCNIFGIN